VPIPDHLKREMRIAAMNDDWAGEEEERKAVMDDFLKVLEDYDGTKPIVINSKGLFEVMAEKMGVVDEDNSPTIETLRAVLLSYVEEDRHDNVNEVLDVIIEKAKNS
jgi:hypothetical protein